MKAKKIISAALAVLMSVNLSVAVTAELGVEYDEFNSKTVYIRDDFENITEDDLGGMPQDWSPHVSGFNAEKQILGIEGKLQQRPEDSEKPFSDAGKALNYYRIFKNGDEGAGGMEVASCGIKRLVSDGGRIEDSLDMDVDVYVDKTCMFDIAYAWNEYDSPISLRFFTDRITYSTQIKNGDEYESKSYTIDYKYPVGEWFHVGIKADNESRTFRLFIDGTEYESGPITYTITDPNHSKYSRTGLWAVTFKTDRNSTPSDTSFYIDNLTLSKDYTEMLEAALTELDGYDFGVDINKTDKDITLPKSAAGLPITWESTDESIITNGGKISTKEYEQTGVLKATINASNDLSAVENAKAVKSFTFTIAAGEIKEAADDYHMEIPSGNMIYAADDFEDEPITTYGECPSGWEVFSSSYTEGKNILGVRGILQKSPETADKSYEQANKVFNYYRDYKNGDPDAGAEVLSPIMIRYAAGGAKISGDVRTGFDIMLEKNVMLDIAFSWNEWDTVTSLRYTNGKFSYSTQEGEGYSQKTYSFDYKFPLNTWVHIDMGLNAESRTFDFFIDGKEYKSGPMTFNIMNPNNSKYGRTDVWGVSFRTDRNSTPSGTSLYIDNFKIYKDYTEELDDALEYLMDEDISDESLNSITRTLHLPSSVLGYPLTWESSDTSVAAANGGIRRRNYTTTATLTAVIGGITDTNAIQNPMRKKSFNITVSPSGGVSDEEILDEYAENCITEKSFADEETVTANLKPLPTDGPDGIKISWQSDNENVISNEGKVKRPSADEENKEVILTSVLKKGDAVKTKQLHFTVEKQMSDIERAEKAAAAIKLSEITKEDPENITKNLNLSEKGLYGTSVLWTSDNEAAVTSEGVIKRGDSDCRMTLTAQIRCGAESVFKTFEFNIAMSDVSRAKEDAEKVVIENADNIEGDFKVPLVGSRYGFEFSWSSNNQIIYFSGENVIVTRPGNEDGDKSVTLTLRAKYGKDAYTRKINVTVKRLPSDEEAVEKAYGSLTPQSLTDEAADMITKNISLTTEFRDGVKAVWKSSDVKTISKTGIVTRPEVGANDKTVTLEVTLTKGNVSKTKTFEFTVKAFDDTESILKKAASELTFSQLSKNPINKVSENLTLPKAWRYNTSVEWSSSDEAVIKIENGENGYTGTVTRGDFGSGIKGVILTAVISYGENTVSKSFSIAVTEKTADEVYWFKDFEDLPFGKLEPFNTSTQMPATTDVDITEDPENSENRVVRMKKTSMSSTSGSIYWLVPTEERKTGDVTVRFKMYVDKNAEKCPFIEFTSTTGTVVSTNITADMKLQCTGLLGGVKKTFTNSNKTVPKGEWVDMEYVINTYDRLYNVYINGECFTGDDLASQGADGGVAFQYAKSDVETKITGFRFSIMGTVAEDTMIYFDDMSFIWHCDYNNQIKAVINDFDEKFLSAQNTLEITDNLIIPEIIQNSTTVEFKSSNPSALSDSGTVTRGDSDSIVTFTALFSYDGQTASRSYILIIKNKSFNSDSGDHGGKDAAETVKKDTEAVLKLLRESYNLNALTKNLSLPPKGENGSTMSYISSNENVLSNDGTVKRGNANQTVTLIISATMNGVSDSKTVDIIIKADDFRAPSGTVSGSGGKSVRNYVTDNTSSQDSEPKNTDVFSDVPSGFWGKKAIETLYSKKVISGRGNGLFEPESAVLREEFVKLAILAFSKDANAAESGFSDVDENEWYAPFIAAAKKGGFINGRDDNTFGVGSEITRQDMAIIIFNIIGEKSEVKNSFVFADDGDIDSYARTAVYYLKSAGIINGVDELHFNPKGTATRAEAAQILYNATK